MYVKNTHTNTHTHTHTHASYRRLNTEQNTVPRKQLEMLETAKLKGKDNWLIEDNVIKYKRLHNYQGSLGHSPPRRC